MMVKIYYFLKNLNLKMSIIEITELEKMRRMLESAEGLLQRDTAYSDEHPDLPTSKRALFLLPNY
jgi:hypothetical protein